MKIWVSSEEITKALVVGVALPVVLFAWAWLVVALFPDSSSCGEYTGCLGLFLWGWNVGRWGAIVLAWPLLYLLRVRPAWPVAILGGAFLVAIWRVAEALDGSLILIVCGGLIAYPVAAWVATPGVPRWVRVLVVGLFAGLFVVGSLAGG
ncbi:hypothetical protein ACIBHX_22780 [Nonomuraea sp. NPDC050536]|uniref:hypothetical protein n=1 Tax=Nonomuraea sp. NPDC050536 TaxID=3364366 RepID=UPI0037CB480A